MRKLNKKLRKWFYIETVVSGKSVEYMVWYGRFTTLPIFGRRYTFIYGLDFELFVDIVEANRYLNVQKQIYKLAVKSRRRRG